MVFREKNIDSPSLPDKPTELFKGVDYVTTDSNIVYEGEDLGLAKISSLGESKTIASVDTLTKVAKP